MRGRLGLAVAAVVVCGARAPAAPRLFVEPGGSRLHALHECLRHDASEALPPRTRVSKGHSAPSFDLVVAMLSMRVNERRRHTLLHSWAWAGQRCSVLFVLVYSNASLPVPAEHVMVADHVVDLTLRTPEEYRRLPRKVVAAFQWIASHVNYKYVLKTDDDTFACLGGLLAALAPLPRLRTYWGKLRRPGIPVLVEGKWRDDAFRDHFHTGVYGVYAFGAGYVLSWDLAAQVADSMLPVSAECTVEDALVGAAVLGTRDLRLLPHGGHGAGQPFRGTPRGEEDAPPLVLAGSRPRLHGEERPGAATGLLALPPVHVVNTSRVKDRDPIKAVRFKLSNVGADHLCARTAQLPSQWVRARAAKVRGRDNEVDQDAARSARVARAVAREPIHHDHVKGGGFFLVVHRIDTAVIRRCAFVSGRFCLQY